jgi:hypothetical protein
MDDLHTKSGPPSELKAELLKEINRQFQVIDDDSDVIHPFERRASNLKDVTWMHSRDTRFEGVILSLGLIGNID